MKLVARIVPVLLIAHSMALGQGVTLDMTTPGNNATSNQVVIISTPGVNVNPAFKVNDMQANWAKGASTSGYSSANDTTPISLAQAPILVFQGKAYIGFAMDWNEQGGVHDDWDIVDMVFWTGSSTPATVDAGTVTQPFLSGTYKNVRVLEDNGAAAGLATVFHWNPTKTIGSAVPYASDPIHFYGSNLGTLGSNSADMALLVPLSLFDGKSTSDLIYWGMQTGVLADGGSDRFGFMDPASVSSTGYLATAGITVGTPLSGYSTVDSNAIVASVVPEPSSATSIMASIMLVLVRTRRRSSASRQPTASIV